MFEKIEKTPGFEKMDLVLVGIIGFIVIAIIIGIYISSTEFNAEDKKCRELGGVLLTLSTQRVCVNKEYFISMK